MEQRGLAKVAGWAEWELIMRVWHLRYYQQLWRVKMVPRVHRKAGDYSISNIYKSHTRIMDLSLNWFYIPSLPIKVDWERLDGYWRRSFLVSLWEDLVTYQRRVHILQIFLMGDFKLNCPHLHMYDVHYNSIGYISRIVQRSECRKGWRFTKPSKCAFPPPK